MENKKKRYIDLTGKVFGRLTVIERAGTYRLDGQYRPTWLCQCDCGNQVIVIGANLRSGMTHSCGCLRRETAAQAMRRRKASAEA